MGFLESYTFKNGATLYGSVIVKKNDGKTDTELIVKYDNKDNQPLTLSDAINEGTDNYEHPAVANTFNMVPNWKLDSFTFVVDSANREIMMEGDLHFLNHEKTKLFNLYPQRFYHLRNKYTNLYDLK